jgi:hypothetical protein
MTHKSRNSSREGFGKIAPEADRLETFNALLAH